MPALPEWWSWELELSPHLLKRMVDRGFNEVELRIMLADSVGYRPDFLEGRWIVEAQRQGCTWEIIVEPSMDERVLLVVTAYPCV